MKAFSYHRRIQYYETDAMAIVHHSNHLKLFEEARVAWFRERKLDIITWNEKELYFPLVESSIRYLKPMYFDDQIDVRLQTKMDGRRFLFQYAIFLLKEGVDNRSNMKSRGTLPLLCATGGTTHAMIDQDFKIVKNLDPRIIKVMEAEPWTETWL